MCKKESVSKSSVTRSTRLKLVGGTCCRSISETQPPKNVSLPDQTEVLQLTNALMNRLWIPPTNTIVGLLDVGISRTNFDELSKWIAQQLAFSGKGETANDLPFLERRFRHAVDRFPEF